MRKTTSLPKTLRSSLLTAGGEFPLLVGVCLFSLGLLLRFQIFSGGLVDNLHRKPDLAAFVEAEKLDFHLVAFLDDIGDLLNAPVRKLADMHQAILRAEEVHEGAEI